MLGKVEAIDHLSLSLSRRIVIINLSGRVLVTFYRFVAAIVAMEAIGRCTTIGESSIISIDTTSPPFVTIDRSGTIACKRGIVPGRYCDPIVRKISRDTSPILFHLQ